MREERVAEPEKPGRTFNKILTSKYFGGDEHETDPQEIQKAKRHKIEQIEHEEMRPKFLRYSYEEEDSTENKIDAVYIAFQKEVISQRGNMIHVTELAFTVKASDFDEFQAMAHVNFEKDFRDLTHHCYQGEERRKKNRETP